MPIFIVEELYLLPNYSVFLACKLRNVKVGTLGDILLRVSSDTCPKLGILEGNTKHSVCVDAADKKNTFESSNHFKT